MSEPYYYKGVKMPGIYRGGAGERGWKRGVDDALKHAEAERFVRAEREGVVDGIRFRRHREEVEALQAEIAHLRTLRVREPLELPKDVTYTSFGKDDIIRNDGSRVVLDTDKLEAFAKKTVFDGLRQQDALHQHAVNLIQRDPLVYMNGE